MSDILSKTDKILNKIKQSAIAKKDEISIRKEHIKAMEDDLLEKENDFREIRRKYDKCVERAVYKIFEEKGLKWCNKGRHITNKVGYIYFVKEERRGSHYYEHEVHTGYLFATCPDCKIETKKRIRKEKGEYISNVEKKGNKFFFSKSRGGIREELKFDEYYGMPNDYFPQFSDTDNFKKVQEAAGTDFKHFEIGI